MFLKHECTLKHGSDSYLPKTSNKSSYIARICRNFHKLTIVSPISPQCKRFFRSNAAIAFERKRHIKSNHVYIIHPFSIFRTYWEIWMTFVYSFALIINPIQVSFKMNYVADLRGSSLIVTLIDFACILDILLTFISGYGISNTKEVVLDPAKIARNYVFGVHFVMDVLSSIPLELLEYFLRDHFRPNTWKLVGTAQLLKIFRFKTFVIYMRHIADKFQVYLLAYFAVRYLTILLLLIHWTACLHYAIPHIVALKTGHIGNNSWIVSSKIDEQKSIFVRYTHCVFRACCYLFCINHGVYEVFTEEDIILGIFTFIVGYLFVSLLLVLILQIVLSVLSPETKYQEIINQVNEYMGCKQLPSNMQKRLISYYEYRFQKSYFREQNIAATLSERLRREINVYCYRRLVDGVSIFKDMPQHVVVDIINCLTAEIFLPNDVIVKAGAIGDCMYFLASGSVCVVTPTGKEVCHLYDGAFFGEIALLMKDQKRIANVIAIEICEVYRLERRHFRASFVHNSDLYKKFDKIASERREKTLILEELHKKYILALDQHSVFNFSMD